MSSELTDITVATHLCGLDLSILTITPTTLSALGIHVTLENGKTNFKCFLLVYSMRT